jgi:hypothetical protein
MRMNIKLQINELSACPALYHLLNARPASIVAQYDQHVGPETLVSLRINAQHPHTTAAREIVSGSKATSNGTLESEETRTRTSVHHKKHGTAYEGFGP